MKLIDVDAAIRALNVASRGDSKDVIRNLVIRFLLALPTVDAEPVIRCKDCKHYDGYYCHNEWWGDGYGNYTPPIKKENGFCDWAERKDDGTD